MIVALFSDVHANLPALEVFVEQTKGVVDAYICLGDIVNYGPWNDECLDAVFSLPNVTVLEGNHEQLFLNPHLILEEADLVQEFSERSLRNFTRRHLIDRLPKTYNLGKHICSHTIGEARVYPDSEIQITQNYIIGHTHHQFAKQISHWMLVNCGSVGQNRRITGLANYVLYDSDKETISLHEVEYPFQKLVNEMISRGYSQRCINYYLSKSRVTQQA
jgi:predicted phosphodiesterase